MADRTELQFRRAALGSIPRGARVLVAVSGGGDSVALLHLLLRLSATHPFELHVAHLDHGLRRGSAADRRFVEALCRERGLPCHADRRDVAAARRRDESPAEAARRVRNAFLAEVADRAGADLVATGHTLDDQAETVLMRLARGAGPAALAAMAPRGPGRLVRPLLGIERAALRAFLERHGLAWREDPSNRDGRYDRTRTRERVLPVLARELNPRAARHLVEAADRLRADAACLDAIADREHARLFDRARARRGGAGAWRADAAALTALDEPIRTRVLRRALLSAGVDGRRVSARHIEALSDLAAGVARGRSICRGFCARKDRDRRLCIEPPRD